MHPFAFCYNRRTCFFLSNERHLRIGEVRATKNSKRTWASSAKTDKTSTVMRTKKTSSNEWRPSSTGASKIAGSNAPWMRSSKTKTLDVHSSETWMQSRQTRTRRTSVTSIQWTKSTSLWSKCSPKDSTKNTWASHSTFSCVTSASLRKKTSLSPYSKPFSES